MPHLQENDAEEKASIDKGSMSSPTLATDLPIKEAREGYLSGSEGLPAMTVTTASQLIRSPVKVESFGSSQEPSRTPSQDTLTPQSHLHSKQPVITPSPFGHAHGRMRYGPIMTIYGNKKLVPSPIRVKRRVSSSEDDNDHDSSSNSSTMSQPTNLRYGAMQSAPPGNATLTYQVSYQSDNEETPKKRLLMQMEGDDGASVSSKKSRTEHSRSPEHAMASSAAVNDDCIRHTPVPQGSSTKKKPLISPTSSGEKGEDDESMGTAPRGSGFPPYGARGYPHPHYPPHPHFAGYGSPPPPYGGSYPMYNGYPPPHFMGGHPGGPPFYPPYPPTHPGMMHQYPRHPPGKFPPPYPGTPHQQMPGKQVVGMPPNSERKNSGSPGNERGIKSVAEWQHAAMATGKPPSANRCVPLKEPIPSKYWGNAEKTRDAALPDFHRLVNFPDYLAKARSSSSEAAATPAGKKNCVMCGKLRVCSASSLVNRGRKEEPSEEEDDGSAHIIPRQNKGLCTACDVTVWVVVTDGLEIKWCKGCKNFRPWAAFGDKGSATKCVRCRDRQREKYAMQKGEIRSRRYKRESSDSSSEGKSGGQDEETHLEAARGLRNLMHAGRV